MEETVPLLLLKLNKPPISSSVTATPPVTKRNSIFSDENSITRYFTEEPSNDISIRIQMLNSLIVRIETIDDKCSKSEELSRLVFSNVKKGTNRKWIIHAYLPFKFLQQQELCSTIKIMLKQNGKYKSTLLDLSNKTTNTHHDSSKAYCRFSGEYSNIFKTGKDKCWVVAVSGCMEKEKFMVNIFDKSIPSCMSYPSCWNHFLEISRLIHHNIVNRGMDEKIELVKLLNFWATIAAVQNNDSEKNVKHFTMIDSDIPKSLAKVDELRTCPLFVFMFIVFNSEQLPDFKHSQDLAYELEKVLFEIDSEHTTNSSNNSRLHIVKHLMNTLYQNGTLYIREAKEKKCFLEREICGEVSKLISLLGSTSMLRGRLELILSLFFKYYSHVISKN